MEMDMHFIAKLVWNSPPKWHHEVVALAQRTQWAKRYKKEREARLQNGGEKQCGFRVKNGVEMGEEMGVFLY